jgi:hypothetical protein
MFYEDIRSGLPTMPMNLIRSRCQGRSADSSEYILGTYYEVSKKSSTHLECFGDWRKIQLIVQKREKHEVPCCTSLSPVHHANGLLTSDQMRPIALHHLDTLGFN